MNMYEQTQDHTVSLHAEQAVLGALLRDNDALDRIADVQASHFYRLDHRLIFEEICRQIVAGKQADAMTVLEKLKDKVEDCFRYLLTLRESSVSSANIIHHAAIVIDKADKRSLALLADEMRELAASHQPASLCVDLMASKLEMLAQKKTIGEPILMSVALGAYAGVLQKRMDGEIRPVSTGFEHVDEILDGGLERGTLTVIAARPGMGKTAAGLGLARNAAVNGSALFLSMEMSHDQVSDRNVSAMSGVPIKWLRKPTDNGGPRGEDAHRWELMTATFIKSQSMNLFIDDKTGLNMLEIRAKARAVKRKAGLDLVVVDQLSFITGGQSDKSYEVVGEYTRALVALSKELDCAVVLLCQLNRKCEDRPNKRPMLADLAMSGSIEQDAANVCFLYRDDKYNVESPDAGLCEWIWTKTRQGEPGTAYLKYNGPLTKFEDLGHRYVARTEATPRAAKGRGGFQ